MQCLLIEVTHTHQRTHCLHQERLVVQLSRTHVELTTDNLVVDTHISRNSHIVDRERLTLKDTNLEVERVGAYNHLCRLDLRHQIAVILVEIRDRYLLGVHLAADTQTLVQRLLVVDVARLYAEHCLETLCLVDRVTHPVDVTHIEAVTLRYFDVDTKSHIVDKVDRVTHDVGIAETLRVVEVEHLELILLIILLEELTVEEEEYALLVCLLECAA